MSQSGYRTRSTKCRLVIQKSLFQICAAIEITAKTEFGKKGRTAYKNFIHQNLALITDIAFGVKIRNLTFRFDHPDLPKNADGHVPLQDIFYHVVRCGLYHEASLPGNLKFIDEMRISAENGVLILPSALIYGLVTAVIVSPANCSERAPIEFNLDGRGIPQTQRIIMMDIGVFQIPINKLWGRREELLWLLDAVKDARRLKTAAKTASEKADGSTMLAAAPPPSK